MKDSYKDESLINYIKRLNKRGIPREDYKRHINMFLEFKAREKAIPISGTFELTPLCNLDCKMCYVHLNEHQFKKENLLSVEKWKKIILQAFNAGMRKASLTGGECLTYPGFDDIYLYLYQLGIVPGILSNGILINQKRLDFFKNYPPKRIQISLYGSSDDAYEIVTGHRVFNTVYNNLLKLKETDIPLKIAITPNRFMKEDIELLLEMVDKLNISYYINSSLITPRKNTGRIKEDLSIDDYIKIYKKRSSLYNIELKTTDLFELPEMKHTESKRYGILCGAGRSVFTIKHDGIMCPCTSFSEINADVLKMGFMKAWETINMQVNQYPLPSECGDCTYKDICFQCVALHKDAPQIGHCNPLVCESTIRLLNEGVLSFPHKQL